MTRRALSLEGLSIQYRITAVSIEIEIRSDKAAARTLKKNPMRQDDFVHHTFHSSRHDLQSIQEDQYS